MDTIRASSPSTPIADMVKIEMEAAEALAGLAYFPANSPGTQSRVKHESNDGNNSSFHSFPKCSTNSYQDATNFMLKEPEKLGILTSKSVKDEQSTDLRLNPTYPTNHASTFLSQAEMEARKIRRVLANRESARQTIHRRQAIFEELTRKAVDLAWENENLKKVCSLSPNFFSLKIPIQCWLFSNEMVKVMNVEAGEESNATNEPTVSASSTNSPFIIYNQPPFLPFVWPNSVQLQCGGIVFPSHIPDSSSCEEGNSMGAAEGSPSKRGGFPPDGGGGGTTEAMAPVSCDDTDNNDNLIKVKEDDIKGNGSRSEQIPVVWSAGKRVGDTAAAEARKRRKQLTRLKNNFHGRQLRIMH
ncbi:Basic-leucine zipper domain-containing protein [Cynara cardunculus var. scolymus]|uniref:Basic-leucine zipper domain-containing protein n=1 Tax=Cynara cardunculus var. scolymus TaxID=59895 RepID=A0A103YF41_CYNCS|nr:Basic-leucine zipper domain-containing protein [Cynara cardunculus var. scolymus]